MAEPLTLFEKIWRAHTVKRDDDGTCLLYIDLHLVHEVTSPQAFEGLRMTGRTVRRTNKTLAVADHNVPTLNRARGIKDPESKLQVETLERNVTAYDIKYFGMHDKRQGIVHIIGPEQGATQPGMTIVCGDSHTATHGAFGALAFGIGTSEVEHVLATQTLITRPAKTMRINVDGALSFGVSAKDVILYIIGLIGASGGTGYVIEYAGSVIRDLSMEARMTICNMSIEAGAKAGLIAPDKKTIAYIKGRPMAPTGEMWDRASEYWLSLPSDAGAHYDREILIDAKDIAPMVTWGTSPQDVCAIDGHVPKASGTHDDMKRDSLIRALHYMGLQGGEKLDEIEINKVFIGSCTNARIEDLRIVADIVRGQKVANHVQAMIVPGSGLIKDMAENEGLDKIFMDAGFEWRDAGCSLCLGMNEDKLQAGDRCASTSNRNFEGRQGRGARTHLCSPAIAAASAITGRLTDIRKFKS